MGEIPFPAWDPVMIHLFGPVDLRYYGLMYVVGFIAGNYILTRLARSGFLPLAEEKVGDLLFALILGVILGGRLGYAAFYRQELFTRPGELINIMGGGLSFHGGLLGVIIAYTLFARRHGLSFFRVGDCLTLAACPGIFAVRIANFINGELWGRKIPPEEAAGVPWAMRFPTEPDAKRLLGIHGLGKREEELAILKAVHVDGTWDKVKDQVPLRHPSQIYEALAEGLLLGLALWAVYRMCRNRQLGTGSYMGIFLLGYGAMRFVIEYFREPDDIPGLILLQMTRGQQLCSLMMAIGLGLLILRRNKRLEPAPAGEASPA